MGWEGTKGRSHRQLAADEMFFGCGEKTSPFNKRGSKTTFWNKDDPNHTYLTEAVYVSIPFLISTRPGAHYGIFWDNTHRTHFNLGQVADEKNYILESDAGEIDYYFVAGDSVREVVCGYSKLTGKMWMPPRWDVGVSAVPISYTQARRRSMGVARNFRKRKIPCDDHLLRTLITWLVTAFSSWNPQDHFPNTRQDDRGPWQNGLQACHDHRSWCEERQSIRRLLCREWRGAKGDVPERGNPEGGSDPRAASGPR